MQSEASATQHTQQAQATFANNGNFFKPVANPPAFPSFPPPPQQPQQQNPYSHPVTPNLPASHPSQQASWVRPLGTPPHAHPQRLPSALSRQQYVGEPRLGPESSYVGLVCPALRPSHPQYRLTRHVEWRSS